MKIAILMHGMAGNTDKYGTGKSVDTTLSYNHAKKHILDINNDCEIDFFMHCWSPEQKENLLNLYKPKAELFEKQIIFDFEYAVGNVNGPGGESNRWVDGKFKGVDNLRFHSLFSRWYSAKIANNLKSEYEKQNNFTYDFVMLTRYDLAYVVDFVFRNFDKNKFYAIPPIDVNHGIQDLWFISNSKSMNTFCGMFDWIKQIKHFPHKFTHSHWLCLQFLISSGLAKNLDFFGPERLWGLGRDGVLLGSSPLVRDYYKLFEITPDEDMARVREEIKKNAEKVVK